MRLKVRKIIKQIKNGQFGQSVQRALSDYTDAANAGHRRDAGMCLCIR